jgi:DNA polymerase-3 subunit gamma/tau
MLDVMEIDAASNRGIDDIRTLREGVLTGPSQLEYKVYIIDEVHMLTTEAFNALLKTLEEPPGHAIFVLATTEVHKLPQTIISRCERFDFHRVSIADLVKRLADLADREKVEVDEDVLRAIALAAEGSVRDAEGVLGQILALGEKKITRDLAALVLPHSDLDRLLTLFGHLVHNETASAVKLLRTTIDEGAPVVHFTRSLIQFLRGVLLRKVDPNMPHDALLGLTDVQEKELDHILDVVTPQYLVHTLDAFLAAAKEVEKTYVPELPLEMAIVDLTAASAGTQTMDLPAREEKPRLRPPSAKKGGSGSVGQVATKEKPEKKGEDKGTAPLLSLAEVAAKWKSGVIERVKKDNAGLALILNVVHPMAVEGEALMLSCKFSFHADRLGEPAVHTYLEQVLSATYGLPLKLAVVVSDAAPAAEQAPAEAASQSPGELWKDVVKTFGEDIVQ